MQFFERLKLARTKAGYSQKLLASKLFISQQAYAKYEIGTTSPNPETLKRISELLEVPTDYLLGRTDNPTVTSDPMTFSERLKESRKRAGITQEALAKKIGVERSSVGKYESTGTIPSPDVLAKISQVLGVSTDYLLTGKNAKSDLFSVNTVIICRRDGIFSEKKLTDAQINALQTIIDSMPDAPD